MPRFRAEDRSGAEGAVDDVAGHFMEGRAENGVRGGEAESERIDPGILDAASASIPLPGLLMVSLWKLRFRCVLWSGYDAISRIFGRPNLAASTSRSTTDSGAIALAFSTPATSTLTL